MLAAPVHPAARRHRAGMPDTRRCRRSSHSTPAAAASSLRAGHARPAADDHDNDAGADCAARHDYGVIVAGREALRQRAARGQALPTGSATAAAHAALPREAGPSLRATRAVRSMVVSQGMREGEEGTTHDAPMPLHNLRHRSSVSQIARPVCTASCLSASPHTLP
eukprot:364360-Chlamydomonas_euryale.AAC.8